MNPSSAAMPIPADPGGPDGSLSKSAPDGQIRILCRRGWHPSTKQYGALNAASVQTSVDPHPGHTSNSQRRGRLRQPTASKALTSNHLTNSRYMV
jgi:hypothetical protein